MVQRNVTERRSLTKRRVDAAKYEGEGRSQCILWDAALPGFGLRIHPTGRKAFVLFYRTIAGSKRLYTVGRYPELTLDQARKRVRRLLVEVADGGDPAAERNRAREVSTVAELTREYLERHARVHKRHVRNDEQRIRDYIVPAWGGRKATAITRADVSAVHRKIGKRAPCAANGTLALVSAMYNWGEAEGLVPKGHPNPARGVQKFKETSRDRWLTRDEVRELMKALETEPSVYIRGFFWLALLTGCRRSELLGLRWPNVDLEQGFLKIPRTKAGRVHFVPLSAPARAVLEALPREQGNPHVFPGAKPGAALVNVEKSWRRIRTAAGVEDARLHDLRRTVGSWLAQHGASLQLVGSLLDHSNPRTTKIYAHLSEDGRRVALDAHAERLLEAVGREEIDRV
jgi:integrase